MCQVCAITGPGFVIVTPTIPVVIYIFYLYYNIILMNIKSRNVSKNKKYYFRGLRLCLRLRLKIAVLIGKVLVKKSDVVKIR